MSRLSQYFLALKPRTGLWFFFQIAALVATPSGLVLTGYRPNRSEEWAMWAAIELGVVLVVLFFSGYVAWHKEWEKNQDKWPHLSVEEGNDLIERLRAAPLQGMRFVLIHRNPTRDCDDLAAQIHDAAVASGWGATFVPSDRPWPPGLTIAVMSGDNNETARTLRDALKCVGISARIATSDDIQPRILLGSKPRLSS